jgi:hypothetical protein
MKSRCAGITTDCTGEQRKTRHHAGRNEKKKRQPEAKREPATQNSVTA